MVLPRKRRRVRKLVLLKRYRGKTQDLCQNNEHLMNTMAGCPLGQPALNRLRKAASSQEERSTQTQYRKENGKLAWSLAIISPRYISSSSSDRYVLAFVCQFQRLSVRLEPERETQRADAAGLCLQS